MRLTKTQRQLIPETRYKCVFDCLCVGHTGELCKNGSTDRDAVRGTDSHNIIYC